MKNWNKYPLFLLLLVSGLLITGAGYAGEHTIYASYSRQDGWMTPGLSLVFQGWKDGVYPWDLFVHEASQTMAGAQEDTAQAEHSRKAYPIIMRRKRAANRLVRKLVRRRNRYRNRNPLRMKIRPMNLPRWMNPILTMLCL